MKTYIVKLLKHGSTTTATATVRYETASWPEEVTWTGSQKEFRLRSGDMISLLASENRFAETVAFQAFQADATFMITEHGAKPPMRIDELFGSQP